jgi:hypothetical protein
MLARKVLLLCSLLIFPLHSVNAAGDGPQSILEGIKAITYFPMVEPGIGGDGCKIDWDNLKTSLEFVANQSTNLKIVTVTQHNRRRDELYSQASEPSLSDVDKEAARKAADDYNFMPVFSIDITPLQVQSACAGTISVYPTGAVFAFPKTVENLVEIVGLCGSSTNIF